MTRKTAGGAEGATPVGAKPVGAKLDGAAWAAIVSGMAGSLVAIGLARFAYTPLVPSLIQAHWFSAGDAVTLGAANFAGYLAGALLGRPMAALVPPRALLRLLMLATSLAFIACAWPLSLPWFFAWRFLSGLGGGAIMVLVATTILPHIPAARRGFASGMIFVGIGLGIAASGTAVPALMRLGLPETWLGLGALSLLMTALSWFGWPAASPPATPAAPVGHAPRHEGRVLRSLYAEYALNALGLVPVMLLLVDYVARGLHHGADIGALYWVLYGVASVAGPVVAGTVADRIGYAATYRIGLLLQAAAVATLAASGHPLAVAAATVVVGALTPGVVPLVLGRIHELLPHSHAEQRAAWSRATTAFALFQALAGYGYSYLFAHSGESYALVFVCGAGSLAVALGVDILANARHRRALARAAA
ncbi:YbfB/YjiJ family MFS transporter [Azospirillum picis]|uniref:MFS family arabinose efflux permease n=1 Tax=Azospirillum picis TaxID=488438 RepID=A0ABU0MNE2_9PROT|nr:YbfB/YjiJ family MFS transporter [Azospirillum picis]MBP2301848.1 putative MFS family arabinose efflux permease [Azospirillum picis]MDQ0534977.1 putative MFS family arabinose efflux permease [Azospirillum picis]